MYTPVFNIDDCFKFQNDIDNLMLMSVIIFTRLPKHQIRRQILRHILRNTKDP